MHQSTKSKPLIGKLYTHHLMTLPYTLFLQKDKMLHEAQLWEGVNIQTSKKLFLLETVYNPQDRCFDSPITILICDKKQTEYTNKSSRMQHLGLVGVSTKPIENPKRNFINQSNCYLLHRSIILCL